MDEQQNRLRFATSPANRTGSSTGPVAIPPPMPPPAPPGSSGTRFNSGGDVQTPTASAPPSVRHKEPPHAQCYQRNYPASQHSPLPPPAPLSSPPPAPVPAPRATSPATYANNIGVKDLGILGKLLVWTLAALMFGGGLVVWFWGYAVVEAEVHAMTESFVLMDAGDTFELGFMNYFEDLTAMNQLVSEDVDPGFVDPARLNDSSGRCRTASQPPSASFGTEAIWPAIELTGTIVGLRPEQGSVILDGIVVGVGQQREGVRVLQVKSDAAELAYQNERRWILSGQMINQ